MKPGTRVRFTTNFLCAGTGDLGTVIESPLSQPNPPYTFIYVKPDKRIFDGGGMIPGIAYGFVNNARIIDHLEVISEPPDSLDDLISTANAGFVAIVELLNNHRGEVVINDVHAPFVFSGVFNAASCIAASYNACRVLRKKTRKFSLKTLQGYEVHMDGMLISIGCRAFNAKELHKWLIEWCEKGGNDTYDAIRPGKNGLTYTGITFSWDACDTLLKELNTYFA